MKNIIRILMGVMAGLAMVAGLIWVLSKTLGSGNEAPRAGKSITEWQKALNGQDLAASNQAFALINAQVLPQLIDQMWHDTNDSKIRLTLIEALNALPGVDIYFQRAAERRAAAAGEIGELGPPAASAVPVLIEALKSKDVGLREPAMRSLGGIHGHPEVVIPLLISYMDDKDLNDDAVLALGHFGSLAKAAVPKIIPMLKFPDKEARHAAQVALRKIDPAAATPAESNRGLDFMGRRRAGRAQGQEAPGYIDSLLT